MSLKPASTYTAITFRRKFEDTPLLIEGDDRTPFYFCGLLEGEFEITVEPAQPDQWWISDVWLDCHNKKLGPHAIGKMVNLDADNRWFYLRMLDSIDHEYGRRIPEWIADEMALLDIGVPYDRVA